jgi:hypothetical protein
MQLRFYYLILYIDFISTQKFSSISKYNVQDLLSILGPLETIRMNIGYSTLSVAKHFNVSNNQIKIIFRICDNILTLNL